GHMAMQLGAGPTGVTRVAPGHSPGCKPDTSTFVGSPRDERPAEAAGPLPCPVVGRHRPGPTRAQYSAAPDGHVPVVGSDPQRRAAAPEGGIEPPPQVDA